MALGIQWIGVTPADLLAHSGSTEVIVTENAAGNPVAVISLPEFVEQKAEAQGVNPKLARKIAFCESTYRQFGKDGEVLRGIHNEFDVGVFQINEKFHLGKSKKLGYNIYSTEGNIEYAIWLIKNEGTRHWKYSRGCWSG